MSMIAENMIGGNGKKERPASDFYPTPREATIVLLDLIAPFLKSGGVIWEPACGENDMVDVMREEGYAVIGTDILDGTDFLTAQIPEGTEWIITNPPFSLAEQFIRRAYETGLPFAFLLKSQFWHAAGRLPLFRECRPSIIAPLTWRPDFNFKDTGNHGKPLMDVLWCVWLPRNGLLADDNTTRYIPLQKPQQRKKDAV